jgi:hypothetical protein
VRLGAGVRLARARPQEEDDDTAPPIGDTRWREAEWAALVVLGRHGPQGELRGRARKLG